MKVGISLFPLFRQAKKVRSPLLRQWIWELIMANKIKRRSTVSSNDLAECNRKRSCACLVILALSTVRLNIEQEYFSFRDRSLNLALAQKRGQFRRELNPWPYIHPFNDISKPVEPLFVAGRSCCLSCQLLLAAHPLATVSDLNRDCDDNEGWSQVFIFSSRRKLSWRLFSPSKFLLARELQMSAPLSGRSGEVNIYFVYWNQNVNFRKQ